MKDNAYKQVLYKAGKYTYGGKCLWNGCNENSIKSHSHTEKLLRNIAFNKQVYGIKKDLIPSERPEFFQAYGVGKASIFRGFCSRHDNGLFKKIEDHDLNAIDSETAFLLLMRNVFFDYYQKLYRMGQLLKLYELMEQDHLPINSEDMLNASLHGFKLNIEQFSQYRDKVEQVLGNANYGEVNFLYKKIDKRLPISLSTNINPLLHNYVPTNRAQPFFALNILPYSSYGLVIISWFKDYDPHMEWIKVKFENDFNRLLNYLCFIESEDFFLCPKFYDKTIRREGKFFAKVFFNRISFPDFGFDDTKIFFHFL